eukprot:8170156-Pyramimonas_sp.AAC.1
MLSLALVCGPAREVGRPLSRPSAKCCFFLLLASGDPELVLLLQRLTAAVEPSPAESRAGGAVEPSPAEGEAGCVAAESAPGGGCLGG